MLRKAYLKKIEEKLGDWEDEISRLRDRADRLEADARKRFQEQFEILRRRREAVVDRIRDVREAGSGSWGVLKSGVEESMNDLKKAVENAVEKLRKIA